MGNDDSRKGKSVTRLVDYKTNDGAGDVWGANETQRTSDLGSVDYFPTQQKDYYRRLLISYKKFKEIGNVKLRDQIMKPEDTVIANKLKQSGKSFSKFDTRSSFLTVNDIKSWLRTNAAHHLGNQKFRYIDRFVNSIMSVDDRYEFEHKIAREQEKYHLNVLREIFQSPSNRKFNYLLAAIAGTAFLSVRGFRGHLNEFERKQEHYFVHFDDAIENVGALLVLQGSEKYRNQFSNWKDFVENYEPEKDHYRFSARGYYVLDWVYTSDERLFDLPVFPSILMELRSFFKLEIGRDVPQSNTPARGPTIATPRIELCFKIDGIFENDEEFEADSVPVDSLQYYQARVGEGLLFRELGERGNSELFLIRNKIQVEKVKRKFAKGINYD